MPRHFPFRNLEPTFFAGLLDDPILLIRIRPTGRNLMFDCGQIHHLAKRELTRVDAIFISHAHMDHWMGVDTLIRHLHASPKTVDLFGPPGIAEKFEHKLSAYDWNLAEDYWGSFRVHEVFPDRLSRVIFSGPEGFSRAPLEPVQRDDRVIYRTRHLQVLAETCEHRVASLIFRINEQPGYRIDKEKLTQLQLVPGPWLAELQKHFFAQGDDYPPLKVLRQEKGETQEVLIKDSRALLKQIERPQEPAAIGYLSDVGYSEKNRQRILSLLRGVDLLLGECTFLAARKERARASFHLCTEDINTLLAELRPGFFLPMHLSKTYSRHRSELYRELKPPPGTKLLQIPLHRTPRPLLTQEIDWQVSEVP